MDVAPRFSWVQYIKYVVVEERKKCVLFDLGTNGQREVVACPI